MSPACPCHSSSLCVCPTDPRSRCPLPVLATLRLSVCVRLILGPDVPCLSLPLFVSMCPTDPWSRCPLPVLATLRLSVCVRLIYGPDVPCLSLSLFVSLCPTDSRSRCPLPVLATLRLSVSSPDTTLRRHLCCLVHCVPVQIHREFPISCLPVIHLVFI
ncbi:hypothetical protein BsWGS_21189 [Bradybaena similaris]